MAYGVLGTQSSSGVGTAAWANQVKANFDAVVDSSGHLMYPNAGSTAAMYCERHPYSSAPLRHVECGYVITSTASVANITFANPYAVAAMITLAVNSTQGSQPTATAGNGTAGGEVHTYSGASPVSATVMWMAEGQD